MAMMSALTEAAFVGRRQPDWALLDQLTQRATLRGLRSLQPTEIAALPRLYGDLCADLARAEGARYSGPLVDYLTGLTAAAHGVLYGAPGRGRGAPGFWRGFVAAFEEFPRAVRRHPRAMLLAFVLFFVPFFAGLGATLVNPEFAYRIVPEAMLRPLTEVYARGFANGRAVGADTLMAGFYIQNNVGIALRCFALGVFFGLGSAFYLVQNGLSIGAVLGYVASRGAGDNILTFVVSHGSLELGAIVLAGGAGLALGWSLVSPGELSRITSLQRVARDLATIVFGAAVMLLLAAGIEGFWSGSNLPSLVKRGVGTALFVLVLLYFGFVGRGTHGPKTI